MPIYEYWCAGCNKEFEQLRADEPGVRAGALPHLRGAV